MVLPNFSPHEEVPHEEVPPEEEYTMLATVTGYSYA
jgi:hypothetical protein